MQQATPTPRPSPGPGPCLPPQLLLPYTDRTDRDGHDKKLVPRCGQVHPTTTPCGKHALSDAIWYPKRSSDRRIRGHETCATQVSTISEPLLSDMTASWTA